MGAPRTKRGLGGGVSDLLRELHSRHSHFNPADRRMLLLGTVSLLLLAGVRIVTTWETWGDLSRDIGHETYVPAMLAAGKVLYRDLWYHYGPAAPYINSALFKVFGVRLGVLYFAGSFSAIASSVLLFFSGIELGFPMVGWTAGAALAIEAFEPGLFSFPLPYSFPAVYGCFAACGLLLVCLRALKEPASYLMLLGGGIAAFGLLLKLEFGVALYLTLGITILLRAVNSKSLTMLAWDTVATFPGLLVCVYVIHWMISMQGVDFITQENIASWPTSYFMKTFGQAWLRGTGFSLTAPAFGRAALQTIFLAGVFWAVRECTSSKKLTTGRLLICLNIIFWLFAFYRSFLEQGSPLWVVNSAFLPAPMVLYVAFGAGLAFLLFWEGSFRSEIAGLVVALSLASLVGFRGLLKMDARQYAIYFSGPVVLSYLILAGAIVEYGAPPNRIRGKARSFLCFTCLGTVMFSAFVLDLDHGPLVPLKTDFGTVRVEEDVAKNYEAGIQFLREKNIGPDHVLILPEDTTMYFLSGTQAPTRVYAFNPGIVAPGHMTQELFNEIENNHVEYLLWSNRRFPEYGADVFGKDFDQELAAYFKSHYQLVGPLVEGADPEGKLRIEIWKRRSKGTNLDSSE